MKQLRSWRQAVDDPAATECLRFFLNVASGPGLPEGRPALFATLRGDVSGRTFAGVVVKLREGERVRITDAGKFGDVGVTTDLDETAAYMARLSIDELSDFADRR